MRVRQVLVEVLSQPWLFLIQNASSLSTYQHPVRDRGGRRDLVRSGEDDGTLCCEDVAVGAASSSPLTGADGGTLPEEDFLGISGTPGNTSNTVSEEYSFVPGIVVPVGNQGRAFHPAELSFEQRTERTGCRRLRGKDRRGNSSTEYARSFVLKPAVSWLCKSGRVWSTCNTLF